MVLFRTTSRASDDEVKIHKWINSRPPKELFWDLVREDKVYARSVTLMVGTESDTR